MINYLDITVLKPNPHVANKAPFHSGFGSQLASEGHREKSNKLSEPNKNEGTSMLSAHKEIVNVAISSLLQRVELDVTDCHD